MESCMFLEMKNQNMTRRWLVLLSGFVIQLLMYGLTSSFGILFPEILEVYGESKGVTAWIGSLASSLGLLTGPITSLLIQKFGYRVTSITGAIMTSLGLFSSMFVPNIYVLYLTFGVMIGVGGGLLIISSVLTLPDYFRSRHAMAVGAVFSGGGTGVVVYPILFEYLLDEYGWKMTLLIQAAICMNCIPCGMVLKPAVTKMLRKSGENSLCRISVLRHGVSILKEDSMVLYLIAGVLNNLAFFIPLFYFPALATSINISSKNAAFLISIHGLTAVFSRLFFGWLSDRPWVNTPLTYSILPIVEGVVIACVPSMNSHWMLVLASFLNGLTGTVFTSMATAVLSEVVGLNKLPLAFGFWCFSNGVGILIGPPLAGWFFDLTGSYIPAFYLSSALFILSGFLMMYWPVKSKLRPAKRRQLDLKIDVYTIENN